MSKKDSIDSTYLGKYIIVRTHSAGVFAGVLAKKEGTEIVLDEARRLFFWQAKKSISLSAVANYGIVERGSKLPAPVKNIWLQPIEMIPTTKESEKSIRECEEVEAE